MFIYAKFRLDVACQNLLQETQLKLAVADRTKPEVEIWRQPQNQLFDPGFLFTPSDSFSIGRTVCHNTKRHRQTDRRHILPKARPIVRSAKNAPVTSWLVAFCLRPDERRQSIRVWLNVEASRANESPPYCPRSHATRRHALTVDKRSSYLRELVWQLDTCVIKLWPVTCALPSARCPVL